MFSRIATLVRKSIPRKQSAIPSKIPQDMEKEFKDLYARVQPYSMVSVERMYATYQAAKYIALHNIPGDIVECGVWRGGSMMMVAYVLRRYNDMNRKLFLYDTYKGMSKPTARDVGIDDPVTNRALDTWKRRHAEEKTNWCYASLEDVQRNMIQTGYTKKNFMYVEGDVLTTIPKVSPGRIALLRLDTDWYESTYHELTHLYPRLVHGGVLLLDDYGHWRGFRDAVDRYMREHRINPLLQRVDYAGRQMIKMSGKPE